MTIVFHVAFGEILSAAAPAKSNAAQAKEASCVDFKIFSPKEFMCAICTPARHQ
jgi:hypothetical protein